MSDKKDTGPTIEIRKAKPGEPPGERLTLTVHSDTDKEQTSESKPITGGLCWVRAREIESSGAYLINPNRGHVAETPHDGDEWSLPVYRCRLCGCLFSPDAKDPNKASE